MRHQFISRRNFHFSSDLMSSPKKGGDSLMRKFRTQLESFMGNITKMTFFGIKDATGTIWILLQVNSKDRSLVESIRLSYACAVSIKEHQDICSDHLVNIRTLVGLPAEFGHLIDLPEGTEGLLITDMIVITFVNLEPILTKCDPLIMERPDYLIFNELFKQHPLKA